MTDEIRRLAVSWEIALRAQYRRPGTITQYLLSVNQWLSWCAARGEAPDFADGTQVRTWLAEMKDEWSPNTAKTRLTALRSFAAWLEAEEGLDVSGIRRVEWPKIDDAIPPALTQENLAAMVGTCDVKTFTGARDAAILMLMFDSLVRSDELLSMVTGDVSLRERVARVRRGKGGKERYTAFGAQTARALDRYERRRERHVNKAADAYWLAQGRRGLSYNGLYAMVSRKGDLVGMDVHPHMTRAGGAIEWRRKGGSITGLMTIAGWTDVAMVQRYTRAADIGLALDEARRLHDQG